MGTSMRRLTAALALAALVPAGVRAAVLERVEVVGGEEPAVRLVLSGPAAATAERLAGAGDARRRLYLDLPATRGPGVPAVVKGSGPILRVRLGQFDARTLRVVLDLADDVPFKVGTADGVITVTLANVAAPPRGRTSDAPRATPPAPTREQARTRPPDARRAAKPPDEQPTPAPSVAEAPPKEFFLAPLLLEAPPPASAGERPAPAPPLRTPAPGSPPLIVVDPGHGGHDPGAGGVGGIVEKDVVLVIAKELAAKLANRLPVSVMLTRSDDSFVPIEGRLAVAQAGATLFISLHANACETPAARGLEVFYGGGDVRPASTGGSNRLAALLGQSLGDALDASVGGMRGDARPGGFAVLARNTVPGALVEIGYLTHPGDAARACDVSYEDMLTDALVDGVGRFLRDSAPRL
jgi:N-acetylmuramoyl-L-alanine amidase